MLFSVIFIDFTKAINSFLYTILQQEVIRKKEMFISRKFWLFAQVSNEFLVLFSEFLIEDVGFVAFNMKVSKHT